MAVAEHNTLWRRVVETNKYVSIFWGGGGVVTITVLTARVGFAYGRILGRGGKILSVLLVLNFGMILGVWGYLFKRVSLKFFV